MKVSFNSSTNNYSNKNNQPSFKMAVKFSSDIERLGDKFINKFHKLLAEPDMQTVFKNTDVQYSYGIENSLLKTEEQARFLKIIVTPHRKNGGNFFTRAIDNLRGYYQSDTTNNPDEIESLTNSLYSKLMQKIDKDAASERTSRSFKKLRKTAKDINLSNKSLES